VKFNLKYKDKDISPIYMSVYYGAFKISVNKTTGEQYRQTVFLRYYIGDSVHTKFWLPKMCRVKITNAYPANKELNSRLQNIEEKTLSIIRELQIKDIKLNNDVIKAKLDEVFRSHKDQTNKITSDLLGFITHSIETSNRAQSTNKTYKQLHRDLEEYEKGKNRKLSFDRIDIDFYNSYISFLQKKGYSPNTVGTRIKILKTFMNEAYERGLHNNLDYRKRAFSKPKEDTKAVYLTEKELEKLYKHDLSGDTRLENVRDWFLIASYTGLRFSDFSRLTRNNIQKDNIEILTQKTLTPVVIPLHTIVKSILEKYDYNLPKVISNQKFNKYIKEVCKAAKVDDEVLVNETKGILRTSKTEKKSDLVSAHTARRSFATNAFLAGVPPIQIMKITGHKTEKAFMIYIRISESENAKKLQLHPFFNRMIAK
ncbi:site-specific integrase, partial [Dysgonomonas sp. Marseille-P4677]|uniref:site-specific integrase n=1 Tax=Dysgonomonas sp. Marseille-P4677 TaxID=2364790 RepID=UPI001914A784